MLSFKTVVVDYNCKFHSIKDERFVGFGHYHFTDAAVLMMLPSLCLISPKQTVSSNQCLCCYTELMLSWPKTKLQNVGAGDSPSTILIDGVPVEGVDEFIYIGSKQRSNGYCRPDVLRRIGLACSVMNSLQNCSSVSISTKVHLYQALILRYVLL